MRYEPGMLALCIDPALPKQMVTLLEKTETLFSETAWVVEFPMSFMWPNGPDFPCKTGWVAQRNLIILPDADPVETETEREVVA